VCYLVAVIWINGEKNPELWMGGNYDCKNSTENCKKRTALI